METMISVVANAMAANARVARNADEGDSDYKDGMKLIHDGRINFGFALMAFKRSKTPEAKKMVSDLEKIAEIVKRW